MNTCPDLNTITDWFHDAKPGDKVCYHEGDLANDMVRKGLPGEREQLASAAEAARYVANLAVSGHVHLVQRRLGDGQFAYIAVRSRKEL